MKLKMLLPILGVASASALAQAPLTEAQMMKYTSKAQKTTIGKASKLNLPLSSQFATASMNGQSVITQTVSHPNASYIKLHFKNIKLQNGGKLVVRSEDGSERYEYTEFNMNAATTAQGDDGVSSFYAMSVSADKVVVEYTPGNNVGNALLAQSEMNTLNAEIDSYYHGTENELVQPAETDTGIYSTCGAMERKDVQCWANSNPTEFERSRPVARLLMNGAGLCTGWRVGSDNRMFTNNHCVDSSAELANTEVWFNYQHTSCNGSTLDTVVKVTGKDLLKTDYTLDYTLFTINDFAKAAPFGYFGLDVRDATQGERIYIPQHGSGNPKELSIESDRDATGLCSVNDANATGRGTGTDLGYYCDTIGGSSGSPVLAAQTNKVIALHHLGGCTNKGAKISLIWPQVSSHFNGQIPNGDNGTGPVDPVDPPSNELQDGVAVSISGATNSEQFFTFDVPANKAEVSFNITGGSGDADLYIQQGTKPSKSSYSCRPYKNGNEETCTVNNPTAGTWHVMVHGYQAFSGVSLKAQTADGTSCGDSCLQNGVPKTNLSGASNSQVVYTIDVPAGVTLNVNTSGGTGDADLYVRKGQAPTTSTYDCRPYRYGNTESCSLNSGTGGTYYIMLRGYNAYSGLTLTASH